MQTISKQLFGTCFCGNKHQCNNITVFSMWFMLGCYKQDSLKQQVSCWLKLSAFQLSEVTWSSWLVSESSVVNSVESRPVNRRLGGWCEMAASWDPVSWELSADRWVLHGKLWRQNLRAWSWRISTAISRCWGMADEDKADWKKA
jgi:hypothetical protein